MKKLIVFLVRRRLGLKKGERFQFTNQKIKNEFYYFTQDALMKAALWQGHEVNMGLSGVSFNWLLNDKCEIRKAVQ